MSVIGKVSAVFTANSSGLVTGVNQAAASMRRMESGVSSLAGGMRTLVAIQGAQFFGGIVSAAGGYVRSLVSMGQAQADLIGRQKDLAAQLGMSYSELAGIAHVASITGVGIESVAAAATKADVALVKAQNGSKQAQSAFAGLGLDVAKLAQMNPADRFNAIAESIANIPDAAGRAAAAVAIFGKSGANLLPMFEEGAAGIAAAQAEAERLGLTLTTAQVSDVDQMGDSFARVQQAISGVVGQIVAYLAPAVQAVSDSFTNLVGSIGGANIGQAIGDGILQGARFLAGIGDYIITNFGSVFEYFSAVGEQWGVVADFMNRAANFMSGVFNAAQAGLGMIVLGFTGSFEVLARIAQNIGQYLGFDTSSIDAVVAGAAAFNQSVSDGISENLSQAQAGFSAAFAENATPVGAAVAGPLTTALDGAIAQAQSSAAQIEESGKGAASEMATAVAEAIEPQAVKGIDSRSSEGVAEMFRLMRGGDTVQEQQLSALEQIAANTSQQTEADLIAEL
jgi:hypothetical protein